MRTGRTLTVFRWRTPPQKKTSPPKIWRNPSKKRHPPENLEEPTPPKIWRHPPKKDTPPENLEEPPQKDTPQKN